MGRAVKFSRRTLRMSEGGRLDEGTRGKGSRMQGRRTEKDEGLEDEGETGMKVREPWGVGGGGRGAIR